MNFSDYKNKVAETHTPHLAYLKFTILLIVFWKEVVRHPFPASCASEVSLERRVYFSKVLPS